jgi:predicted nucleic acid-binding protein
MAWCFTDESTPYTESVFDRLWTTEARVPAIWLFEITNVLLVAERAGRLAESDSARFLRTLRALPILVETDTSLGTMTATFTVGRQHGLSAYDAAYVELAMREGLALATLDERVRNAAVQAGVPLVE